MHISLSLHTQDTLDCQHHTAWAGARLVINLSESFSARVGGFYWINQQPFDYCGPPSLISLHTQGGGGEYRGKN